MQTQIRNKKVPLMPVRPFLKPEETPIASILALFNNSEQRNYTLYHLNNLLIKV